MKTREQTVNKPAVTKIKIFGEYFVSIFVLSVTIIACLGKLWLACQKCVCVCVGVYVCVCDSSLWIKRGPGIPDFFCRKIIRYHPAWIRPRGTISPNTKQDSDNFKAPSDEYHHASWTLKNHRIMEGKKKPIQDWFVLYTRLHATLVMKPILFPIHI